MRLFSVTRRINLLFSVVDDESIWHPRMIYRDSKGLKLIHDFGCWYKMAILEIRVFHLFMVRYFVDFNAGLYKLKACVHDVCVVFRMQLPPY